MVRSVNHFDVLGAVASVISFVLFMPQAMKVWTHRSNPMALDGVSEVGQWLLLLNAVLWGIYGVGVGVGAYWSAAPSLVTFPMALFVIALLRRTSKTITSAGIESGMETEAVFLTEEPSLPCGRFVAPAGAACTAPAGTKHICSPLASVGA